jgi:LPS-assembly lipoprotein
MRMINAARLCLLILALSLAACGFELRGTADLSFKTLYIQGPALSISPALKKALKVNGIVVVDKPEQADLLMETISDGNEKRILSLSGGTGTVREYELFYRAYFRLRDPANPLWGEVQTIEGRRDFSYTDAELLAKQYEEQYLYEDMRQDAVREIMRRLVVQKPKASIAH